MSDRPANIGRGIHSLLDLAPDEVYQATDVTGGPVGSYPTFSPLPRPPPLGKSFLAVYFLRHWLSLPMKRPGIARHHPLRSPDFPLTITSGGPARQQLA